MAKSPATPASNAHKTYLRLLAYARPYRTRLLVGIALGAVSGTSMSGIVGSAPKVLERFFGSTELDNTQAILVAAVLPCFAIITGVCAFLATWCIQWVGARVVMDLRNQAFGRLQDLSLDYYSKSRAGDVMSRVINDTNVIEKSVAHMLGDLAKQPFILVSAVAVVLWLDWQLALISLLVFPICVVPVAIFGRRVRRYSREGQKLLGDALSALQEAVSGVRVVKAFGMEDYEKQRFAKQSRGVFSRSTRVARAGAANEPIIVFISMVGLSAVFIYAHQTGMSIYKLFGFGGAMMLMYTPVKTLSKINNQIQIAASAADRVFELVDTVPTVQDRAGAIEFTGPVTSITLDNVSFAYDQTKVLDGINLEVRPGEFIALVGQSGSGKTTLANLLPRFYDVDTGAIRINNRDLRDHTLKSIRAQFGIVTQDTFLFNDTIAANIAYGRTDATREAIEAAAKKAFAHDFILQQPHGYETVIGDRGITLSGGQRQRISIARAILRNAPILILDEATSALDTESERLVQAALDELMRDRTVFAIAHRLSTILHATKIIVLEKGRIIETGTHAELLARTGTYRRLHDLQFRDPPPTNG